MKNFSGITDNLDITTKKYVDDQISSKGTGTVKGVKANNTTYNPDTNGIVDVGSVLTSDSNFVHLTGNEIINGNKTFTSNITIPQVPLNDAHATSKLYVDSIGNRVTVLES